MRGVFVRTADLISNLPTAPLKSAGLGDGSFFTFMLNDGATIVFFTSAKFVFPLKNASNGSMLGLATATTPSNFIDGISSLPDCWGNITY